MSVWKCVTPLFRAPCFYRAAVEHSRCFWTTSLHPVERSRDLHAGHDSYYRGQVGRPFPEGHFFLLMQAIHGNRWSVPSPPPRLPLLNRYFLRVLLPVRASVR